MESHKDKAELFIQLLTANHYRIYSFIYSLVANASDADDIMQDTSAIMWKKFADFKSGTDFVAWGVTIAKYRVMEFRKKRKDFSLSDETISMLADESQEMMPELENRLQALSQCMKKLSDKDCNMLQMRYTNSQPAKEIAQRFGTTVNMVYRNMSRIKVLLSNCVRKQLKVEEC